MRAWGRFMGVCGCCVLRSLANRWHSINTLRVLRRHSGRVSGGRAKWGCLRGSAYSPRGLSVGSVPGVGRVLRSGSQLSATARRVASSWVGAPPTFQRGRGALRPTRCRPLTRARASSLRPAPEAAAGSREGRGRGRRLECVPGAREAPPEGAEVGEGPGLPERDENRGGWRRGQK